MKDRREKETKKQGVCESIGHRPLCGRCPKGKKKRNKRRKKERKKERRRERKKEKN